LQHGASLTSDCQASNDSFKSPGLLPEALAQLSQAIDPATIAATHPAG